MLLIEPARINLIPDANFVDSTSDNIPDGWDTVGVPGTAFAIGAGGPHGGKIFRILAAAAAGQGAIANAALLALTTYSSSAWRRRLGSEALTLRGHYGNPGWTDFASDATEHDWTRIYATGATVGADGGGQDAAGGMTAVTDPTSETQISMPQVELGGYASTWIPSTGGAGSRAVEVGNLDSTKLNGTAGFVSFLWCPGYSSADLVAGGIVGRLISWRSDALVGIYMNSNRRMYFENGAVTDSVGPFSWNAWDLFRIQFRYGSSGVVLDVNGTVVSTATPWPAVVTSGAKLGSGYDGSTTYTESAAFGDLLLAGS